MGVWIFSLFHWQSTNTLKMRLYLFLKILYNLYLLIFQIPFFSLVWFFFLIFFFSGILLSMYAKSLQSHLTLCSPMDRSLPGPSVHGILQARILEWIVMPSSRGPSPLRDWTCVSCASCIGRQVLYHCEAPLNYMMMLFSCPLLSLTILVLFSTLLLSLLGNSLKLIFQLTHLFFIQVHPTYFLIVFFNFPAEWHFFASPIFVTDMVSSFSCYHRFLWL